jgi:hypothetical protein
VTRQAADASTIKPHLRLTAQRWGVVGGEHVKRAGNGGQQGAFAHATGPNQGKALAWFNAKLQVLQQRTLRPAEVIELHPQARLVHATTPGIRRARAAQPAKTNTNHGKNI